MPCLSPEYWVFSSSVCSGDGPIPGGSYSPITSAGVSLGYITNEIGRGALHCFQKGSLGKRGEGSANARTLWQKGAQRAQGQREAS